MLRTADLVQLPEAVQDFSVPSDKLARPAKELEAALENSVTACMIDCVFF